MARQTKTPGVATVEVDQVDLLPADQTTTETDLLNNALNEQTTTETSSASEPTSAELLAQIALLKQQLANQQPTQKQSVITPTAAAPTTGKRIRQYVGPNGWATEEY